MRRLLRLYRVLAFFREAFSCVRVTCDRYVEGINRVNVTHRNELNIDLHRKIVCLAWLQYLLKHLIAVVELDFIAEGLERDRIDPDSFVRMIRHTDLKEVRPLGTRGMRVRPRFEYFDRQNARM